MLQLLILCTALQILYQALRSYCTRLRLVCAVRHPLGGRPVVVVLFDATKQMESPERRICSHYLVSGCCGPLTGLFPVFAYSLFRVLQISAPAITRSLVRAATTSSPVSDSWISKDSLSRSCSSIRCLFDPLKLLI
jgi:hypothetical protein